MKLINFQLEFPTVTTTLLFNGKTIDLHNEWSFSGFNYDSNANLLIVRFIGAVDIYEGRCLELHFSYIKILHWNTLDMTNSSDRDGFSDMSKVLPGEYEFPHKDDWGEEEEFEIEFKTEVGGCRIACDEVRLVETEADNGPINQE